MKTTLKVKLCPSPEQYEVLRATMKVFNEACTYVAEVAFKEQCYSKFKLHRIVYYDIRSKYGLVAQMAIRVISKVTDAYKKDRSKQIAFRPYGAVVYDQRIMAFKRSLEFVSLSTIKGRQLIPIILGGYQNQRMKHVKGQADLVLHNGTFYLLCTVETPEKPTDDPEGFIGVDLGIVQIAVDSTGESFSGAKIDATRERISTLRSALQSKGTKSAKRHLKQLKGKESRFHRDVNHCISKKLVEKAKRTKSAIVLEDLKGIRRRIRARKSQRARMSSWSFWQLRSFIEYKAKRDGVKVILVDPKNTSHECSVCGHVEKKNRKSQAEFRCVKCGHSENADLNAAKVISKRATVNKPIVSGNPILCFALAQATAL